VPFFLDILIFYVYEFYTLKCQILKHTQWILLKEHALTVHYLVRPISVSHFGFNNLQIEWFDYYTVCIDFLTSLIGRTENEVGLVWYTDRSKTNKATGAGVYSCSSSRGQSFVFGRHIIVFQAEIYTIKGCIMENNKRGYTWRYICIFLTSSYQGCWQFPGQLWISLGLQSVLGGTGRM
jgi:hypothetical protein